MALETNKKNSKNRTAVARNTVYTAMLALAFIAACATVIFVATKAYTQYETIFKIVTVR